MPSPRMRRRCAAFALTLSALAAHAAPAPLDYRGVSLAGAEFGEHEIPGVYGKQYVYPSVASSAYFQAKGMNLVRLPFLWERLQPALGKDFDAGELARLHAFVDGATANGLQVLLDPHNYARWRGDLVGSDKVPDAAFADFWRRLALQFKDNPRVLFGLVNEPHDMPTETWVKAANAAIAAIRDTGARNIVSVPGNAWSGGFSWFDNWYGTPNAVAMLAIADPADRLLIESHQYLDADSSGTHDACVSASVGVERLARFTAWLREHHKRALLGEIGAGDNPLCREALTNALDYVHANRDVWTGWLWWAAGPSWGDYFMSIEPGADGADKPQMRWLAPYLPGK